MVTGISMEPSTSKEVMSSSLNEQYSYSSQAIRTKFSPVSAITPSKSKPIFSIGMRNNFV